MCTRISNKEVHCTLTYAARKRTAKSTVVAVKSITFVIESVLISALRMLIVVGAMVIGSCMVIGSQG